MRSIIIFIVCLSLGFIGFSQVASEIDAVTPFQGELAAVKKGNSWGFMNKKGMMVIDYRNDFVIRTNSDDETQYPVFKDERCLIRKMIDGNYYYGYINTKGEEIIPAKFLNATKFQNGFAIVVTLLKDSIGFNKVLEKNVTSNKLEEYVIDTLGIKIRYLENPIRYTKTLQKVKYPPIIRSKFIAPRLIAVLKKNRKWDIYKF
jgi:hypothetical protein